MDLKAPTRPLFWILALAFLLRAAGASWGLPQFCFYMDEHRDLGNAIRMMDRRSLDPRDYVVPPGFSYQVLPAVLLGSGLRIAVSGVHYGILFLRSDPARADFWRDHPTPLPGCYRSGWDLYPDWFLWGRLFSACVGTATVFLLYRLAQLLAGQAAAPAAALILACEPMHVRLSHYARHDVLFLFWITWGILALARAASSGRVRDFLWCGFLMGVASAVKYWGIILVPAVLFVFLRGVREGRWGWRDARLWGCAAASVGGLCLFHPWVLLKPGEVLRAMLQAGANIMGEEMISCSGFLRSFPMLLGIVPLLAAGGVLALSRRRAWDALLLLLSPGVVLCAAFLLREKTPSAVVRYAMPLIAGLAVLAGAGLAALPRRGARLALTALAVAWPFHWALVGDEQMLKPDTRERALAWTRDHLSGKDLLFVSTLECGQLASLPGKQEPYRAVEVVTEQAPCYPLERLRAMGVTHVATSSLEWGRYQGAREGFYAVGAEWHRRLRAEGRRVAVFAADGTGSLLSALPWVRRELSDPLRTGPLRGISLFGNPTVEIFDIRAQ